VTTNEDKHLMFLRFHFSLPHLARIDSLSARMKSASREETLRRMVCAFGEKYEIKISSESIPECLPPVGVLTKRQRRNLRQGIGLMVPKEREGGWLDKLQRASGEPSINHLLKRVVDEFNETILP
jgi:hypothetical protein